MSGQAFSLYPIGGKSILTTANPNRDGSGALVDLVVNEDLTGGIDINTVIIKAQGSTSAGMIRLFIYSSTLDTYELIYEIPVAGIALCSTEPTFSTVLDLSSAPCKVPLGYTLYASTQNSDVFTVSASGIGWANNETATDLNYIQYETYNSVGILDTANPNLDGTGSGIRLSDGTFMANIRSVTVTALGQTTQGMIRFFLADPSIVIGGTIDLIHEVPVLAITPSATTPVFSTVVGFPLANFNTNSVELFVTTQNSEAFSVVLDAVKWSNQLV